MESEFVALFGEPRAGRPREEPIGVATGDPAITEKARRRATRVLRTRHADEFEELMEAEAAFLLSHGNTSP